MFCALAELHFLRFAAHPLVGVHPVEAQALAQTGDNEVETVSSEYQHGSPFSQSSWTGLVDLDTAGVRSIAGSNNSSEISEEHVVVHLKPEGGWDQNQNALETIQHNDEEEEEQQPLVTKAPNMSGPESHGGSAQEEEDHYSEASDTPTLSTTAPQTPQTQTSNSVLADIVESLMRPFRYWTGDEETQKEASGFRATGGEGRAQMEGSTRNPSLSKAGGNKGDTDNTIKEQTNHTLSIGPLVAGVQSPHEGLSEQEKETTPPNPKAPMVHKTAQSDTLMLPVASSPPSAVNGMIFCV